MVLRPEAEEEKAAELSTNERLSQLEEKLEGIVAVRLQKLEEMLERVIIAVTRDA